jgi:beta-glucosidase
MVINFRCQQVEKRMWKCRSFLVNFGRQGMPSAERAIIASILILSILAGCTAQTAIPQVTTAAPVLETPSPAVSIPSSGSNEQRVEALLAQMTLDEKIGQMTQAERGAIKPGDVSKYFLGSVLNGGGGLPGSNKTEAWLAQTQKYQHEALSTRLRIPILFGVDAVHGHAHVDGATIFPQAMVRQAGAITGEEMQVTGIQWNFAPVVAVPQDIRWGRTYESFGEDTALVSELATAYIQGQQELPENYQATPGQTIYVMSTAKHFLGDGGTIFGTSTQTLDDFHYLLDQGDTRYDEAGIRELFLPPYQAAVNAGVGSVMASFSSLNGKKMHEQKIWLTDVLKGELVFDGLVVSDWAGIDQVDPDYYQAVVKSINAGIDINMVALDYVRFITTMKRAAMKGDISIERIDDAVRRILLKKFELGLFDHPYGDEAMLGSVGSAEHRAVARQAVSESLVLLKNENLALPIPKTTKTIFVGGKSADDIGIQSGGWTIEWQGKAGDILQGTTILEGIREAVSSDTRVEYSLDGKFDGKAEIGIAVVGELPYAEGPGDVSSLLLKPEDVTLIQTMRQHCQKLIVVLVSGRPMVITPQYDLADAWVAAWLPGSEGEGVADVLTGKEVFTGKLPFTWPRNDTQLPININNIQAAQGCNAPLFPYGYGLGYGLGTAESKILPWGKCPGDK